MQASKLERANRIKYLRALDGALIKITKSLKRECFDLSQFKATTEQIIKTFSSLSRVTLDSEYAKNLEDFINACCFENLSQEHMLARLNALDKLRKTKRYKKNKHKKQIFEEQENV